MKVTPLDLRQQKFKTVMRGYDRAEVEAFLNETAEDYEQALREADRLRDDLVRSQSSLDEHREGERNLRNTLLTAQRLADEIRNNAEAEGKRLVREAEGRSDLIDFEGPGTARRSAARNRRPAAEAARRRELAGVDDLDAAQLARIRARAGSEGTGREDPAPSSAPDRGAAGCAGAGARRAEGRRGVRRRIQPRVRIQRPRGLAFVAFCFWRCPCSLRPGPASR